MMMMRERNTTSPTKSSGPTVWIFSRLELEKNKKKERNRNTIKRNREREREPQKFSSSFSCNCWALLKRHMVKSSNEFLHFHLFVRSFLYFFYHLSVCCCWWPSPPKPTPLDSSLIVATHLALSTSWLNRHMCVLFTGDGDCNAPRPGRHI